MIKVLPLFEKLTNIKGIKSYKLKDGITNINYKIKTLQGDYVIRIPRRGMVGINHFNQAKVLEKVKDLNVEVIYYDSQTGILISKYVKHKKRKEVPFKEVIDNLKTLHSIDITSIDAFDPFLLLKEYKKVVNETMFEKEEIIVNQAKKLYSKYPLVFSHNDLLYSNFIKSDDKNYLIDYEYAGKNIALFDIVSFLFENNIEEEEKQKQFIKQYFNNIDEELLLDIKTMHVFQDMLWGYWAFMMYYLYKDETFLQIGKLKQRRYNSIVCNY